MTFYSSYVPRTWEIGIGFYKGHDETEYTSDSPIVYTWTYPTEIALLLGPFTLAVTF